MRGIDIETYQDRGSDHMYVRIRISRYAAAAGVSDEQIHDVLRIAAGIIRGICSQPDGDVADAEVADAEVVDAEVVPEPEQIAEQFVPDERPYRCPDGGACHHACGTYPGGHCWRVHNAEPLSDVYPDDRWPTPLPLAVVGDLRGLLP